MGGGGGEEEVVREEGWGGMRMGGNLRSSVNVNVIEGS